MKRSKCVFYGLFFLHINLIVCSVPLSAQNNTNWKKLINNDFDKKNVVAQPANDTLGKFSPAQQLTIITTIENDKSVNNSKIIQAKIDFLKTRYTYTHNTSFNSKDWKYWGLTALASAELKGDEWLAQCCYKVLGDMFFAQSNYDTCIFYHLKSIEKATTLGYDQKIVAGWKINASDPLYHTRNYKEVIDLCMSALKVIDKNDVQGTITAWNNTALSYMKLGNYDSANYCYDQLISLAKKEHIGVWVGIATGNKGDILYLQNKEKEALPYWQADVDSSTKYGEGDNAFLSKAYINRYQLHNGMQATALKELQLAFNSIRPTSVTTKMNVAKILAEAFSKLNQNDSANFYNKYYFTKTDSINQIISRNNYSLVKLKLDYDKSSHEVVVVNKERKAEVARRNLLVGLLVFALVVGILLYNRQRLKSNLAKQQNQLIKTEIEAAKKQLQIFTQTLLEKNIQIEQLSESLESQNNTANEELVHKTLLTDYDWNLFKELFEKSNPAFFQKLKDKAPGITQAEIRLAALIKLNMGNKEIASMQGISLGAVRTTKVRLRQKLTITIEDDLDEYIKAI